MKRNLRRRHHSVLCTYIVISGYWYILSPTRKETSYCNQTLTFASHSKKKFRRLSVQPGLHGSNDVRVGWKMVTFQLFFYLGRAKVLSALLYLQIHRFSTELYTHIFWKGHASIIATTNGVRSSNDWTSSLQGCHNPSLWDWYGLLFHGFMDWCPVPIIHLQNQPPSLFLDKHMLLNTLSNSRLIQLDRHFNTATLSKREKSLLLHA